MVRRILTETPNVRIPGRVPGPTQPTTRTPRRISPHPGTTTGRQHCANDPRRPGPSANSAFTDPKALVSNIFGSYRVTRCINNVTGTAFRNPWVWSVRSRRPAPYGSAGLTRDPTLPAGRRAGAWHEAPARPPDYEIPRSAHYTCARAPIAQLVELRTFNPQVPGSSPGGGTLRAPGHDRAPALFPGQRSLPPGIAGDVNPPSTISGLL